MLAHRRGGPDARHLPISADSQFHKSKTAEQPKTIFASHFRDRVHLTKKCHLESGLYQRDEDPHGFSVTQVPMSPRENSLSGGVTRRPPIGTRAGALMRARFDRNAKFANLSAAGGRQRRRRVPLLVICGGARASLARAIVLSARGSLKGSGARAFFRFGAPLLPRNQHPRNRG